MCYETGEPCQINVQVFNNTILNQTTCTDEGFLDKGKYKLNVNISVCYQTAGPCQINVQVFNNTILNQTTCTDEGFLDKAKYKISSIG